MKTYLREGFFTDKETTLVEAGELKATLFTYSTGVKAVRISNAKGSATVLPFDGQAVWRCDFLGRELTMKSIYDEPQPCTVYGETYGFFIMHCGLTAMGKTLERELLSACPNVKLVLCGHNDGSVRWEKAYEDDHVVNALMYNFQDDKKYGLGYLRILTFDPMDRSVHVTTYSPWFDDYDYQKDAAKDTFTLENAW